MANTSSQTHMPGRQLLPVVVDERNPKWLFARVPRSPTNLQDGFLNVTCGDFARAVNRAAGWLEDIFGQSLTFDTLAYLGPSDIRYTIFVLGASKVGFKTLLPSPRNSLEGQLALFKATNCKAILTPKGYTLQPGLLDKSALPHHEVQETTELLADGEVRQYKFNKVFEEAKDDPLMILHTSGSTGLPKPIVLTHGWISAIDRQKTLGPWNGHEPVCTAFQAKSILCALPPFHGFGVAGCFIMPLLSSSECCCIWLPAGKPINTITIDEFLDSTTVELMVLAPSLLEEIAQLPESFAKLVNVERIITGGGPLSKDAGYALSQQVRLVNLLGATETGIPPCWLPSPEDWQYFYYNPAFRGVEFREVNEGLYQLFLKRHPSTDHYHGTWSTFPNLSEYTMNDLYTKHPTKDNLWLYAGRADDVIVLSNGEKLNPTSMELTLVGHLGVTGSLIVGQGRFAPAAIIELEEEHAQKLEAREAKQAMIDLIWPYVIEANKSAPSYAQLAQDKIIFSKPGKPFARAAKGTIIRRTTVKIYEQEINELYEDNDKEDFANIPQINLTENAVGIEAAIGSLTATVLGVGSISTEQDFFAFGMDSLQVMKIARRLEAALDGKYRADAIARLIYANTTVAALAAALEDTSRAAAGVSGKIAMQKTLERFAKQLPLEEQDNRLAVILTGSTGSLGSYLLDCLFLSKSVRKIYCLNRRADAAQQQSNANADRGLVSEWGERVVFLHADLSKLKLGLNSEDYENLRNEAGVIIHNQWQVNFNLTLPSFEPHIAGAVNLIRLSSESHSSLPIFFTSSIGTLGNWASEHPGTAVPEVALEDPSISMAQGYSESKWITERLLDAARRLTGVSSAILRVGQIAGPVNVAEGMNGMWNRQEWLPTVIQSSKYLKLLPSSLGGQDTVTWIPVDILAAIIVELVCKDCLADLKKKNNNKAWTKYYHLVNPHNVKWSTLVPIVQEYFAQEKLHIVGLDEWVDKLEASGKAQDADATQNPGLKLLGMYQGLKHAGESVILDTKATRERSKVMQNLPPVNQEWMRLWLKQWAF